MLCGGHLGGGSVRVMCREIHSVVIIYCREIHQVIIVTRYHERYTKSLAANSATHLSKLCDPILLILS